MCYRLNFFLTCFCIRSTKTSLWHEKPPLNFLRGVLWDEAKAKEVVFDMVVRGAPKELY